VLEKGAERTNLKSHLILVGGGKSRKSVLCSICFHSIFFETSMATHAHTLAELVSRSHTHRKKGQIANSHMHGHAGHYERLNINKTAENS